MADKTVNVLIAMSVKGAAATMAGVKSAATSIKSIGDAATKMGGTVKQAVGSVAMQFLGLQKIIQVTTGALKEAFARSGIDVIGLQDRFSDFQAQMGSALIPLVQKLTGWFDKNREAIMTFASQLGKMLSGAVQMIMSAGAIIMSSLDFYVAKANQVIIKFVEMWHTVTGQKEKAAIDRAQSAVWEELVQNALVNKNKQVAIWKQGWKEIVDGITANVGDVANLADKRSQKEIDAIKKANEKRVAEAKKGADDTNKVLTDAQDMLTNATKEKLDLDNEIRKRDLERQLNNATIAYDRLADQQIKLAEKRGKLSKKIADKTYYIEGGKPPATEKVLEVQTKLVELNTSTQVALYDKAIEAVASKKAEAQTKLTAAFAGQAKATTEEEKKLFETQINDTSSAMALLTTAFDKFQQAKAQIIAQGPVEIAAAMEKNAANMRENMTAAIDKFEQDAADKQQKAADAKIEREKVTYDKVVGTASDALGRIAQINDYYAQKDQDKLNKETEQKKKIANSTIKGRVALANEISKIDDDADKKSKELAKRGQKIAFVQAVMDTASAVVKTFAAYPFPWSLIPAGIVGGLGAVQSGIIASQAFAQGGIVNGTTPTGDRSVVRANPGEVFLNNRQQANLLMKVANSPSGGGINIGPTNITINGNADQKAVESALSNSREKQMVEMRRLLYDMRDRNMVSQMVFA